MEQEREYSNNYMIPANYTDSGKLFGGMLEVRNTVEAVILIAMVGYPQIAWLPLQGHIQVILLTVTIIPLGVFALMGIGGDSLLQYITQMIRWWLSRRQLHYQRIGYKYETTTKWRKARPQKEEG